MCDGSQVPVVIDGKPVQIDSCLTEIVSALNAGGIRITWCCCGHGKSDGFIYGPSLLLVVARERDEGAIQTRYYRDWDMMARQCERQRKAKEEG